jgi:hypothetical protein
VVLILQAVIDRLDDGDRGQRLELIKLGASDKARFTGTDLATGFLMFEWPAGRPLCLINPNILPS